MSGSQVGSEDLDVKIQPVVNDPNGLHKTSVKVIKEDLEQEYITKMNYQRMRQEEKDRINITKSSVQEETKKPYSISKIASNASLHPSLWNAFKNTPSQKPIQQKSQS